MEKNRPTISVCICTYNQDVFLEQAIRSVLEQTSRPFEIIVCDDCSTDSTPMILDRLSEEISCLKVIRHSYNLGIAKNVDACLRVASGEFIVRLDSDDYLKPGYIEQLATALLRHPDAGYAHAAVQEVDENGSNLKERKLFRQAGFQSDVEALKEAPKGYKVAANIIMFRKSALKRVNYLSDRPNFGEDYHLATAISAAGYGNIYISDTLACYRVWTDQQKLRTRRKRSEIEGIRRVFDEVIGPAYNARSWTQQALNKRKTHLACSHVNCLGWDVYGNEEKMLLLDELHKLSPAIRVRLFSWLYLNGYGGALDYYNEMKGSLKGILKSFLTPLLLRLKM